MIKNSFILLTFLIIACSSHFSFAKTSKIEKPSKFKYDTTYFNQDGSCKPFRDGFSDIKYKLSPECGKKNENEGMEVSIGLAKYSDNTFDVILCMPQLNPSPLTMDKEKSLQGAYTQTHITLETKKSSSYTIQKHTPPFLSGPKNRKLVVGDKSLTFHTLGNGGIRTLKNSSKKPEECQIKIEKIGTKDVIFSGGGRALGNAQKFDSTMMKVIEKMSNEISSGSEERTN